MNKDIRITTTEKFEGIEIKEYLNPVIAHVVTGMNFFNDFVSSITDIVGGNSNTYEVALDKINNEVITKIKDKAFLNGGNCILNLRIENNEISSKGKGMLMVTAIGTAAIADFSIFDNNKRKEELNKKNEEEKNKIQHNLEKEKQNDELMKKYNIIFKDDKYYFGEYRYSNIEDALNYAKNNEKKK